MYLINHKGEVRTESRDVSRNLTYLHYAVSINSTYCLLELFGNCFMAGTHRGNHIHGSAKYKGQQHKEFLARGPGLAHSVIIFGLQGNKPACQYYTM